MPSAPFPGPLADAPAAAEQKAVEALYAEVRSLRERLVAGAPELIEPARAVLDRVLFVALAERRSLAPKGTLSGAVAPRDEPLWSRLLEVLRGMEDRDRDSFAAGLQVSDDLCRALVDLGARVALDDVPVHVLGHVLERSLGDLEAFPSKRHDEGVYFTPAHVTRAIVELTLGRTLDDRREAIFQTLGPGAKESWEAYREALLGLRVLDPACGAGAFLVAAYDLLRREHQRVEQALADLRGEVGRPIDAGGRLLGCLFGVDRSAASVAIARRSLWLEAAQDGGSSAVLDENVQQGDSIVEDPALSPLAFDWSRWPERFDVVIGNPPWVRHELFPHLKEHLGRYAVHHGMADLYVYFFERGLSLLRPGGRLGFIVSNKWLRAGYAAPLRAMLARRTEIEHLVDFGHAPIFRGADAFPCVVVLRGEAPAVAHEIRVTTFPRSDHAVPQRRLGDGAWSLEPASVERILRKMEDAGPALAEVAKGKPRYGIKTGCNEAFVVDDATRCRLVAEDESSRHALKPLLRGQDMGRWSPSRSRLWVIYAPWDVAMDKLPAIRAHLERHRASLEGRAEVRAARFPWYALSRHAADSVEAFSAEKIVYQVIQYRPAYGLDGEGRFLNDKGFFIPSADRWLLAVLNSPLMWWYTWRRLPHMKDEALNPSGVKMERIPIAGPDDEARSAAETCVPQLVASAKEDREARAAVLEALRTRLDVDIPGHKLEAFEVLSRDGFLAEVGRRRPRPARALGLADRAFLGELYDAHAPPIHARRARALEMERRLADLVNRAYGLTAEEVELLWATAPPRMPLDDPRRALHTPPAEKGRPVR